MQVDLFEIKALFDMDITTKEIAQLSDLAYTTIADLRNGNTRLEKASFKTLVQLTLAYQYHTKQKAKKERSSIQKKNDMEAAIGINEIDGIALTNKDLEKYYDYANGKISSSELEEYIKNVSKEMVRG